MKHHTIIINKSEIGAGKLGSSHAYEALQEASVKIQSNFFKENTVLEIPIYTNGQTKINTPFAKNINIISVIQKNIIEKTQDIFKRDTLPIIISGDHSSASATIKALKNSNPNKRLGIVWIDAHADLHTPYTTPSGNMHGMPVAAILGLDNLSKQKNQLDSDTLNKWNEIKFDINNAILPSDIVYIGLRDLENEEIQTLKELNIAHYSVEFCRKTSIEKSIELVLNDLKDCDHIYISFDVDSMDPDLVSYGTGTPVKGGFSKDEIIEILQNLIKSNKISCCEIVEINPLLENKGENKMAETTLEILDKVFD